MLALSSDQYGYYFRASATSILGSVLALSLDQYGYHFGVGAVAILGVVLLRSLGGYSLDFSLGAPFSWLRCFPFLKIIR